MQPHTHFPALPIEGKPDSPHRVESFEDLACVDCWHWREMVDQTLLPRFGDRVAFISRDFPLEKHHWAESAAMVSRRFAAWDVEASIEFRRFCLSRRGDITVENFPERVSEFAEERGLDAETSVLSMQSEDLRAAVRADLTEGRRRGVYKTPTVFVGDREFVEKMTAAEIVAAIEALLASTPNNG